MANYEIENMDMYYAACNEVQYGKLNDNDKRCMNESIDEYRRTHTEEF